MNSVLSVTKGFLHTGFATPRLFEEYTQRMTVFFAEAFKDVK